MSISHCLFSFLFSLSQLKRLESVAKDSDSDEDPWSEIDQQQMEIRRDIFDIKLEQHRRSESQGSQSDISSTPTSPVKEFKEFAPSPSTSKDDIVIEDLETLQDINQNIEKVPQTPQESLTTADENVDTDFKHSVDTTIMSTVEGPVNDSLPASSLITAVSPTIEVPTVNVNKSDKPGDSDAIPTTEVLEYYGLDDKIEANNEGNVLCGSSFEENGTNEGVNSSENSVVSQTADSLENDAEIIEITEKSHKDTTLKKVPNGTTDATKTASNGRTSPVVRKNGKGIKAKSTGAGQSTVSSVVDRKRSTVSSPGKSSPSLGRTSVKSPVPDRNSTPSPKNSLASRSSTPTSRKETPTANKRNTLSPSPRGPQALKDNGATSGNASRASSIDSLPSVTSDKSDNLRRGSSASGASSIQSVSKSRKPVNSKVTASASRNDGAKKTSSRVVTSPSPAVKVNGSQRTVPGSAKRVTPTKTSSSSSSQPAKSFVRGAPERTTIAAPSATRKATLSAASATRSSLRGTSKVEKSSIASTKSSSVTKSATKDSSNSISNSNFKRAGSVRRSSGPTGASKINATRKANVPSKASVTPAKKAISATSSPTVKRKEMTSRTARPAKSSGATSSTQKTQSSKRDKVDLSRAEDKTKSKTETENVSKKEQEATNPPSDSAVKALHEKLAERNREISRSEEIVTIPLVAVSDTVTEAQSDDTLEVRGVVRSNSNPDLWVDETNVTLRNKSRSLEIKRYGLHRHSLPPKSKNPLSDGRKSGKSGKFSRIMNRLSLSGSKKSDKVEPDILEGVVKDDVFGASPAPAKGKKASGSSTKEKLPRNKSTSFRSNSKTSPRTVTSSSKDGDKSSTPKKSLFRSASMKSKEKSPVKKTPSSKR